MADSKRYMDWYEKSLKDLEGARILFKYGGDFSIVAFHCQQSLEKLLKGYILKETQTLAEGHSLVYLCKKAIEFDASLKSYLKDCAYINQFYIETRYPADIPTVLTQDEAQECILIAEKLQKLIGNKFYPLG